MVGVYHGIVVKESLDERLLGKFKIVGQKQGNNFLLLKVEVSSGSIKDVISLIQHGLKDKKYYAHFYRKNELIIVFKDKVFHVSPDKTTWNDVITYGLSLGIPAEQLDFKPCRFEDETY